PPEADEMDVDGMMGGAPEFESPDVAVAETELVFPEIEEQIAEKAEAVPKPRVRIPEIIPSKARVRVAGKQLPLGHPTWAAVDILVDEPALRATQAHALSSMEREVAGVLVGPRPEKQPDGRYLVHIIDMIVARHTVMQGASVTYTPESWRYLNDTLAQRYPDDTAVMVGWYHTHPGFGIFLSGMDLFIHQNFFTQIWHVALVLDPRARTSGFFCWDRPKSRVSRCDFAWPSWAAGSW
ncbi:MAG: Mov34/MPN/PAD-1 family protein, partial [Anaerolineaceae bacterium]